MKTTENYNLNKPDAEDFFSHEHMNQNMDVIDGELKQTVTTKENQGLSDTEKSNARANIDAAETNHGTHIPDACNTITDWDNAITNGWYMGNDAQHAPCGGWLYGEVIAHNKNWVRQIVYRFAYLNGDINGEYNDRYERTKFDGKWTTWINTSVKKSVPSDAKFTDTVYTHPTTSGNKHIPSGGASGQYLKWSADGTAKWEDEIITITKTLTVGTSWIDTGIVGSNLSSGSYIIQVSGMTSGATSMFSEVFTGVMTWHAGDTNSGDSDEIILHNAGHASNGRKIYLRTLRQPSNNGAKVKLQIAANNTFASSSYTFKFRKMI